MFWKLVELLIGSEWRTFCGFKPERFLALSTGVLDELEYSYSLEEVSTTSGERTMLGADQASKQIIVSDPATFKIEIVRATADPITGAVTSLVLTPDRREEVTGELCVVDLSKVNDQTRNAMAVFINRVIAESDRPPWEVTHHIGFRLAVLLRMKVRLMWGYWRRL